MGRLVIVFDFEEPTDRLEAAHIVATAKEIFKPFESDVKVRLGKGNAARKILRYIDSGHDPDEPSEEMSNLERHARRELELIGEERSTIDWYCRVVHEYSKFGHSGGSAAVTASVLDRLLRFQNLSELTDNPNEWMHISEDVWGQPGGIWQNIRNSEAFSNDGGKTYYLLSEGASDKHREPLHESKKVSVDG